MMLVAANESFLNLLPQLKEQVALCDDSGKLLGYYVPVKQPTPEDYAWLKAQFTEEELDRASQQTGGRSLQEIMRDLERLP